MLFTSTEAFSFVVVVNGVSVTLDPVTLLASDVTISVFTPFTVFTMVVCGADDVVVEDILAGVCDGFAVLVVGALADVPSAGKALGELVDLVVFVAVLSVCSLNGSSLLSLSESVLLLLLALLTLLVFAVAVVVVVVAVVVVVLMLLEALLSISLVG